MAEREEGRGDFEGVRALEIRGRLAALRLEAGDGWRLELPPEARVDREGERLRIEMPVRWRSWLAADAGARLQVTAPPGLERWDVQATGEVEVAGLGGSGRVEVKAGDVHVRACSGELRVDSGAGDVTVEGHRGRLLVHSGAGDVRVRGGFLEQAEIRSGAGDVAFAARVGREASLRSGAGQVELRPESDGEARIEVHSGFGDVSLYLDGVRGGRLEVRTGAGSVEGTAGIRFTRRGGVGLYSVDELGPGSGWIRLSTGAGRVRLFGQPGKAPAAGPEPPAPGRRYPDARAVLEALARGEIDPEEAERLLDEL
ncbi:MAG: DUF4097 family beta strand repeat-containing protein [Firmicutes bacterium]|nr:DUF4097 family beta strand repeat-containing protein [Bacillota bacterium]